uniref:Alpha-1-B glycoprotein n=2 Tax=Sus scrofa TaxID=9823 RepID=A0A8D1N1G2_PIG
MSAWVALLLLWGLALSRVTEEALFLDPRPNLWAEAQSLLEPWANVTLTCQSRLPTLAFQLLRDGVAQDPVRLASPALEHRFPLGAVTSDTRGLYRCRSGLNSRWTGLSNLVEVTGSEPLPPPLLSTKPVPWITPGLNTELLCHGGLHGVTFLLRREGDDQFLEVVEAPEDTKAIFPVKRPGGGTWRTELPLPRFPTLNSLPRTGPGKQCPHGCLALMMARPPPPTLTIKTDSAAVLSPGSGVSFTCVATLEGVHFQLRRGEEVLMVPRASTSPDRIFFQLNNLTLEDRGFYTCSYQLRDNLTPWSLDSAPVELVLSDGTLPAPELSAEPAALSPAPGSVVQLRCRAPRSGVRFALVRKDAREHRVHGLLSPEGTEALFELRDVSGAHSGNYSCVYTDLAPPFSGSAPSASVELRVDGPLPRPQLRPRRIGAVTPGRDAVFHCEGRVPDVIFELLRAGKAEPLEKVWSHHPSADLVLTYVGPQHAGKYSCRYRSYPLLSELSDPVELQVAGE